jgi:monoamine oxidase
MFGWQKHSIRSSWAPPGWQVDPFAHGAYSYVLVGGTTARKALAAPVEGTLFFAGEETDISGVAATVGGALQSRRRAARQVLTAAVGRRRSSPARS